MIGDLCQHVRPALVLIAGAWMLIAQPATADEGPPTSPEAAVRSLHQVQDAIAQGDQAALEIQADLMGVVDQLVRTIDPDDLRRPETLQALLSYAVSGGNPATLLRVRERIGDVDLGGQAGLAEIVTALMLQRPIEESQMADAIRPAGMLGGGVALLNAVNAKDPAFATRFLNAALLDAPGTLIEETALRRLMRIHLQQGDIAPFLAFGSRYARQFINSPYAFEFAATLVEGGRTLLSPDQFEQLSSIFDFMPPGHRQEIVSRQMRSATLGGNFALVRYLGARFARDVAPDGTDMTDPAGVPSSNSVRQRLFLVMADIDTLDHAELTAELAAIDAALLPEVDRPLLAVAKRIAADIVRPPQIDRLPARLPGPLVLEVSPSSAGRGLVQDAEPDNFHELIDFIANTRQVLDDVDALLSEQ